MTEAAPAAATPHASPPSGGGEDPRGAAATTTGAAAARGVPWATVTACAIVVGVFGVTHLTPGAMPFASWGYRGDAFQYRLRIERT